MNEILLRTEQEINLDNKTQYVYESIIDGIKSKGKLADIKNSTKSYNF